MNVKNLKSIRIFIVVSFCAIILNSCASVPKDEDLPMDLTPAELQQKAQYELDVNNYRGAKVYYEIIKKRFPDDEKASISADFEIAHILVKQKKWEKAKDALELIIEKYAGANSTRLPPQFYRLASNDLKRVEEKLTKKEKKK